MGGVSASSAFSLALADAAISSGLIHSGLGRVSKILDGMVRRFMGLVGSGCRAGREAGDSDIGATQYCGRMSRSRGMTTIERRRDD